MRGAAPDRLEWTWCRADILRVGQLERRGCEKVERSRTEEAEKKERKAEKEGEGDGRRRYGEGEALGVSVVRERVWSPEVIAVVLMQIDH